MCREHAFSSLLISFLFFFFYKKLKHFRADLCYSSHSVRNLNLIHFNSPKKLNVRNAKAQLFRNQYLAFQQYDGNLLRRELVGCEENVENENLNNEFSNEGEDGEECFELRRAKDIIYR